MQAFEAKAAGANDKRHADTLTRVVQVHEPSLWPSSFSIKLVFRHDLIFFVALNYHRLVKVSTTKPTICLIACTMLPREE